MQVLRPTSIQRQAVRARCEKQTPYMFQSQAWVSADLTLSRKEPLKIDSVQHARGFDLIIKQSDDFAASIGICFTAGCTLAHESAANFGGE